jgi:hypothetical protein
VDRLPVRPVLCPASLLRTWAAGSKRVRLDGPADTAETDVEAQTLSHTMSRWRSDLLYRMAHRLINTALYILHVDRRRPLPTTFWPGPLRPTTTRRPLSRLTVTAAVSLVSASVR